MRHLLGYIISNPEETQFLNKQGDFSVCKIGELPVMVDMSSLFSNSGVAQSYLDKAKDSKGILPKDVQAFLETSAVRPVYGVIETLVLGPALKP
jgi:hypothetical protein